MKSLLKLEYVAILVLSLLLFSQLDYQWWMYVLFFLVPDIGMVGYVVNTKVGAFTYNFTHHYATAVACLLVGFTFSIPVVIFAGTILLGHSAFDRLLGYGLKYSDSFKHTHINHL